MDTLTVTLMLGAGLLHASWHSLVKAGQNQITVLAGMGGVAGLCAAAALPFVPLPPSDVWLVLIGSVSLHIAYKLCLARAYKRGDFGQVFALARGTVPLFATLIAFFTLDQIPTSRQSIGLVLVSSGLVLLTFDRLSGVAPFALLLAAAAAGAAVAAYATIDAYGTRLFGDWFGFTAWLVVLDSFAFLIVSRLLREQSLWTELREARWRVVVSGILGLLSFSVFLGALSRNTVGAVATIRETSVLFAMAIGVLRHHERLCLPRIGGAALIFAAIVVTAI